MSTQSTSIAKRIRSPDSRRSGKPRKRAEQERSQATRSTILEAALAEFAEKGFAAASIRSIAERTGFQHPLLTYHYRTKDLLWRAVAEDTFARIRDGGASPAPREPNCWPLGGFRL